MVDDNNASLRANPNGDVPQVDDSAYIDPSARVIGNVRIGANVYVGPYAVIRADEVDADGKVKPVTIAAESNVQDGVIVHALGGTEVKLGRRCSLAHGCVVHGPCVLGDGCFVGFRAAVYDSVLGDGVFVGTSAVVQGVELGAGSLVRPAMAILSGEDVTKSVETTGQKEKQFMQKIIMANLALAKGYLVSCSSDLRE